MDLISITYRSFDCKIKSFFINSSLVDLSIVKKMISQKENLSENIFNFTINGKNCFSTTQLIDGIKNKNIWLNLYFPLIGGKGGFGSMLRAIGAQIEKTTNKEACRDLRGRRLRDINAEKRLKAWLAKQNQSKEEKAKKKREKLEKMKQEPKVMFDDNNYLKNREEIPENVDEALEIGLKKLNSPSNQSKLTEKRKSTFPEVKDCKKPRKDLWLGLDDLEGDSEDDDLLNDCEDNSSPQSSTKVDCNSKEDLKLNQNLNENEKINVNLQNELDTNKSKTSGNHLSIEKD